jgi:hypothetical protein
MKMHVRSTQNFGLSVLGVLCLQTLALAQAPPLTTPQESSRATVSQTIGITQVTVTYNRPSVKGRKVWGELVPTVKCGEPEPTKTRS